MVEQVLNSNLKGIAMSHSDEKMIEEICHLRAVLRSVTDVLDSVLDDGLPGKGRGQDEKESIEAWWEDRVALIRRAREVLDATNAYNGIVVR